MAFKTANFLASVVTSTALVTTSMAAQAGGMSQPGTWGHASVPSLNCRQGSFTGRASFGNRPVSTTINSLNISKPFTVNNNINVYKPVNVNNNLNVQTNIDNSKQIDINKPVSVNKNIDVNKPVTVNRNIDVNKPVSINKNIDINKPISITKNIDNSKNINITNNIDNSKNIDDSKNININKTIIINKGGHGGGDSDSQAEAEAVASAVAAAVASSHSSSEAIVNFNGSSNASSEAGTVMGGSSYIADTPGAFAGGDLGAINVEIAPAPAQCTFQDTTVIKAIHAVCLDASGHEFPASHMVADTWINSSYEGEVARCIPGSRLKVVIGKVMQSSEGMATGFTSGQVLQCALHEVVRHYKDGVLKCAPATPVPDCTERTNLRKYGTGDMFFTYRAKVCLETHEEYPATASIAEDRR